MTRFVKSWLGLAATTATLALGGGQAFAQKDIVFGLQCDRTGPTAERGHGAVPRLPGLHRPGEQQGRGRGLQDQGPRDRQRVQGAAGHRGARALQEGRRRARGPLWHAADGGAEQEARGGQDPRHVAGLRHGLGRRRQTLSLHLPDRGQLLVAGGCGGEFAKEKLGDAQGQEDRLLFYDNPAGKEPLPILEDLAKAEGFELRTFAVPAPGLEMGAQVLDITGRFKPDFIIAHLFGRAPSVLDQGAQGQGLPAQQGGRLRLGQLRSRYHCGRRHGHGRRLQHHPVRRRRQGLSGDQGNRGHVQGAGQDPAEGNGLDRSVQSRCA